MGTLASFLYFPFYNVLVILFFFLLGEFWKTVLLRTFFFIHRFEDVGEMNMISV